MARSYISPLLLWFIIAVLCLIILKRLDYGGRNFTCSLAVAQLQNRVRQEQSITAQAAQQPHIEEHRVIDQIGHSQWRKRYLL